METFIEKDQLRKTILASIFMALAFVLPFATANNMLLGQRLLLMHIPILLCGIVCGPKHGMAVGFMAPILRAVMLGAPPLPIAIAMAFELAAYGFFIGFAYKLLSKILHKKTDIYQYISVYVSLIIALIAGRLVFIAINFQMLSIDERFFEASIGPLVTLLTVTAWPGILIQIAVVPLIFIFLKQRKMLPN